MKPIRTILHTTDFSDSARLAMEMACALARDPEARMIVMHVVPQGAPAIGADREVIRRGEIAEQELHSYREEMRGRLEELQPRSRKVHVEHVLKEGPVAEVILRMAEETPCDLIVMGTHGAGGCSHKALGSVTEEVMKSAPCPVVIVKTPVAEKVAARRPSRTAVGAS